MTNDLRDSIFYCALVVHFTFVHGDPIVLCGPLLRRRGLPRVTQRLQHHYRATVCTGKNGKHFNTSEVLVVQCLRGTRTGKYREDGTDRTAVARHIPGTDCTPARLVRH